MFVTVDRNARRLEDQISGLLVALKQTREELEAERQRTLKSESNLEERIEGQAVESTANRRNLENLETQLRRLEALVADAIGARDKVQGPERSSNDSRAAATSTATTADQGTLKASTVSNKDGRYQRQRFCSRLNPRSWPYNYILAYFTANHIAHTISGACRGNREYSSPSHLNRKNYCRQMVFLPGAVSIEDFYEIA